MADANSLFVEKARLSVPVTSIALNQKSARSIGCDYIEGHYLFTTSWGEAVYAHYYNGILFAALQDGNGFKPRHWLTATGMMDSFTANCFAEDDPHNAPPTQNPNPNPPSGNNSGTGLLGSYYNNTNLSGSPIRQQVDGTVNFGWGDQGPSPASGVPATNMSVRWSGQVEAPVSGTYKFKTNNDDATRLTINGQQLINDWPGGHGPTWFEGSIYLNAGQKYSIILDFNQGVGGAQAQLHWEYPGQGTQIIPQSRLYPDGATNPPNNPNPNPGGNCPYSEGQYLFTFNTEVMYAHLYNGILYATYQDGSNFRPRHWLVATGLMNESTASCFAEIDPASFSVALSTGHQVTDYYDYDDDPVSFGGAGGLGNSTVGNILPSNLTPYSAELQQVFPHGLAINDYYEYELQIMANNILAKLGLTSMVQLEQPPFLPLFQLDGINQMLQVSREFIIVKQKHPNWSNNRCLAQAYMNYCLRTVHIVLDVAGLVPGAGELPDAINGGIYLLEGDKTNAALSFAATIPIAGWAATETAR